MEYLIAVDLEGIHGVVGEPYSGLVKTIPEYKVAVTNAVKEINTVVKALYDGGAKKVSVWDNHGGSGNIDFAEIDPRVEEIDYRKDRRRYDFVKEHHYKAVLFLGYHAKEGTLGAVLAHTFSSVGIQYVKVNGRAVGELDTDTWINAKHGIPTIFAASDDKGIAQVHEISEDIATVITKYGTSRNTAELREETEVLQEMYDKVLAAMKNEGALPILEMPAQVEVRYTRMEHAAEIYDKVLAEGEIPVEYGEDAHILNFTVNQVEDIPYLL